MPDTPRSKENNLSDSGRKPGFNKSDEELPGYPHYPASEDIMNPANGFEQTTANTDNLTQSGRFVERERTGEVSRESNTEEYDDLGIVPGTEADVTSDDLLILGPKEGDQDLGDDELVSGKIQPIGHADEDLDIPGAELDDENEVIGEEDEENNYYSLGGDNHENLEENQA